jgi:hypothetical protein
MRWVVLTSIVLAAGCASSGTPAEPPVAKEVPIDATNIVEAQQAGYKVVKKDGPTLYCKRNLKTGTRLNRETTCLSEEEWRNVRESSQQSLEAMRRTTPPKLGQ